MTHTVGINYKAVTVSVQYCFPAVCLKCVVEDRMLHAVEPVQLTRFPRDDVPCGRDILTHGTWPPESMMEWVSGLLPLFPHRILDLLALQRDDKKMPFQKCITLLTSLCTVLSEVTKAIIRNYSTKKILTMPFEKCFKPQSSYFILISTVKHFSVINFKILDQ